MVSLQSIDWMHVGGDFFTLTYNFGSILSHSTHLPVLHILIGYAHFKCLQAPKIWMTTTWYVCHFGTEGLSSNSTMLLVLHLMTRQSKDWEKTRRVHIIVAKSWGQALSPMTWVKGTVEIGWPTSQSNGFSDLLPQVITGLILRNT